MNKNNLRLFKTNAAALKEEKLKNFDDMPQIT